MFIMKKTFKLLFAAFMTLAIFVLVLVFNLGIHGIWLGILSDQLSRFSLMRRRFRKGEWVNLRI